MFFCKATTELALIEVNYTEGQSEATSQVEPELQSDDVHKDDDPDESLIFCSQEPLATTSIQGAHGQT